MVGRHVQPRGVGKLHRPLHNAQIYVWRVCWRLVRSLRFDSVKLSRKTGEQQEGSWRAGRPETVSRSARETLTAQHRPTLHHAGLQQQPRRAVEDHSWQSETRSSAFHQRRDAGAHLGKSGDIAGPMTSLELPFVLPYDARRHENTGNRRGTNRLTRDRASRHEILSAIPGL